MTKLISTFPMDKYWKNVLHLPFLGAFFVLFFNVVLVVLLSESLDPNGWEWSFHKPAADDSNFNAESFSIRSTFKFSFERDSYGNSPTCFTSLK